jgi:murein DD-endopeptidase MepM/ murein hydrolase activator NlpD
MGNTGSSTAQHLHLEYEIWNPAKNQGKGGFDHSDPRPILGLTENYKNPGLMYW